MTIYILDEDPKKTAEYLDDKSLNRMIKDIAQVLCSVHYDLQMVGLEKNSKIPIDVSRDYTQYTAQWTLWSTECKANYQYLVDIGINLINEYNFRFSLIFHKYADIIEWGRDNVPNLPYKCRCKTAPICMSNECEEYPTELPLVMPKKYIATQANLIEHKLLDGYVISYRKYYQNNLKCHFKRYHCTEREMTWAWTNREKPEWINL
jgi:hypothetical protein